MAIQINGDSGISGVNGSAGTPALQGTDSNTGIVFGTDTVQISTGGTARATVDSSGRVGIGTTSPGSYASAADDLVVYNSGSAGITIRSGSSNDGSIYFNDTDDGNQRGIIRYVHGDDALAFHTPSGESMRIDSSGTVGIGTTSPQRPLHVNGTEGVLRLTSTASGNNGFEVGVGTASQAFLWNAENSHIEIATNNTERMRIDSSGKVLVATTSPSNYADRQLTVGDTSLSSSNIEIRCASNGFGGLTFSDSTASDVNSYRGTIEYGHSTNHMQFRTDAVERMRIDSSGRLLVGTTTSNAAPLTVAGSVGFGDSRFRAVFGDGYLDADSTNTFGAGNSEVQIQAHQSNRPAFLSLGGPQGTNEGLGAINFFNSGNTDGKRSRALIYAAQEGSNSDQGGRLGFYTATDGGTSPTERMRIGDSGYVATHMSSTLGLVLGTAGNATNYTIIKGKSSSSGINSGNDVFYVYGNGNVQNSNNSYGQISDQKLKENIVDANSQWNNIKEVRVRNFNFIEGQTHTQIGVVAQELETVSPGLIDEAPDRDEDGNDLGTVTKSVKYSVLYMKAVKALQEAMTRIETLEARVNTLEAG